MDDYREAAHARAVARAKFWAKVVAGGMAVIFALTVVFGTAYNIDEGNRGVILTNGAISGEAGPGLHWKMPMLQDVEEISMRQQRADFQNTGEGGDFRMSAYSRDQQPATIAVYVNYRATNASEVYRRHTTIKEMENKVINGPLYETVKAVMGKFSAAESIRDRAKLNAMVVESFKKAVVGAPLIVDGVFITDIKFSSAYENAVEQQMTATVKEQQAIALKNQRMTAADAALYEQKAIGDAVAYRGMQEAKAIEAKGAALRNNPGVVELTTAQAWNGILPTTMVPGGAVPFISVK